VANAGPVPFLSQKPVPQRHAKNKSHETRETNQRNGGRCAKPRCQYSKLQETQQARADGCGKHAIGASVQLNRRGQEHERRLHCRETCAPDTNHEQRRPCQVRGGGECEGRHPAKVERGSRDVDDRKSFGLRDQRDQPGADQRADPVPAGKDADALRPESQRILTDHGDHAEAGPAEEVEDHGDQQHRAQPRRAQRGGEAIAHLAQHGSRPLRPRETPGGQLGRNADRDRGDQQCRYEGRRSTEGREQRAAQRQPRDPAGIVGDDVERHRRSHPRAADRLADQHPPHGIVGGPAEPRQRATGTSTPKSRRRR
jgi:hypothetical protein